MKNMVTPIATISKKVSGGNELVVVRRADFEIFDRWRRETRDALSKVNRGREEYRNKKTVIAPSPRKFR